MGLLRNHQNCRVARNLEKLKGLIFSQPVLVLLRAKECYRQHAYLLTQRISLQAWNTKKDFKQLLLSDPDVQKHLDNKEIEEIFSLNYHLKHVEEIFLFLYISLVEYLYF